MATNSIRGGTNRAVLDEILEASTIFAAWSDEPWVVDGAAVRVSLVCFASKNAGLPISLNNVEESRINADLTAGTLDLTRATPLKRSKGVAFQGDIKRGPFDIPGDMARELASPACQSQRSPECRCSQAMGQWNGLDPPFIG